MKAARPAQAPSSERLLAALTAPDADGQSLAALLRLLDAVVLIATEEDEAAVAVWGAVETLYGRSATELLARPTLWREQIVAQGFGAVPPAFDRLDERGIDSEYRLRRPDGSLCRVRQHSRPLPQRLGEPRRAVCLIQDAGRSKNAVPVEALLPTEQLPDRMTAIVSLDADGRIVAFDAAAEQMFGLTAEQAFPRPFADFLTPPSQTFLAQRLRHPRGEAGGQEATLVGLRGDGAPFPLETLALATNRPDAALTLVLRDLTERFTAEARLHHLSRAIEQIAVAVRISDLQGNICYVNQYFCELHGGRPADFQDQQAPLVHAAENAPELAREQWQTVMGGREWQGEQRCRRRDGSTYWASVRIIPIHDPHGTISHFITLKEDISAQRAREEQDRQRQEQLAHSARLILMGEMSSMLAHEINQPLTAIAGYSAACGQDLRDDPAAARVHLDKLNQQVRRAGEIVWRMRDFSRAHISAHRAVPLAELVHDVLEWFQHKARHLNVTLRAHVPAGPPIVAHGDRLQIEQVMVNLVGNAFDALDDTDPAQGRHIEVIVGHPAANGLLQVSVQDNGVGMRTVADDELIYRPFFTTKPNGLGLGLAVCRSIVEDHGGQLWHSTAANGRTGFHFTLRAETQNQIDY